jgi:hypothetical protein
MAGMPDKDIRREDVQGLNNADQIAAFFAVLGYRTDARLRQTPANLGITAESLARHITRLERIADHEGLLQVYLFELSSVTVAATRGIASALRNRAGDYLLVLTHDYDGIDFVLVEKSAPVPPFGPTIGQKQVSVRPRPLTVERRNPSRVALRVLRRLSYTELDPPAQLDKLKSAFDIADWSDEHFNNRALFADYYLRERLPETDEWQADAKPASRELRQLCDRAQTRWAHRSEEELRRALLELALRELGFALDKVKEPNDDRPEADYELRMPGGSGPPLAVCLTYRWNRFLDGKDEGRDTETPDENPGAVVVSLLERGDAPYAIVTNGKHWRLYAAKTHCRATNYYEIDLEETLALNDPADAFRYFWLLFRAESLTPKEKVADGERIQSSLVDDLLRGSAQYAKRLGDRLKDRIFEEIFPHLAEGFIEHTRARDGKHAALAPDRIFQGALTLLYRLLFLLYAEARDLLPVKEVRGYFERSLSRIKQEVAEKAGDVSDEVPLRLTKAYSPSSTTLYDRLTDLFRIVDRGDPDCNVPVYNGGLFLTQPDPEEQTAEAEEARFLQAHKIPDRFLALGLDLLARDDDEKTYKRVAIDYKSLGVRQLGSIYEGLLEFRLRIAPEKMAICKGKKAELIVPYAEAHKRKLKILTSATGRNAKERTLAKGAVYLENDKRERKATGSYYTPDYVVEYIVANTVGPVLDERFDRVRPQLREAQKLLRRERQKAKALGRSADDPGREAYLKSRAIVDELFGIRVLDPAMGSGHFLVEAVDFITDRMLDFLNGFPWNPVVHHLRETRETIEHELEKQGVSIDRAKLTDVNLLKRHVLKRCIYGVDVNPMAVELAKMSLWLDSFTLGAPLSFLDHHLKPGNSLVGAKVEEVNQAIRTGQLSLLSGTRFEGMKQAVAGMISVGELPDVTAAQVRESRLEFRRASDAMAPAKRLLDVFTSQWFGNTPHVSSKGKNRTEHNPAVEFLRDAASERWAQRPNGISVSKEWQPVVATAAAAAAEKRFFHWELEFPEVFYGPRQGTTQVIERKPDGGFDAVIGNPPWIRQETLQADKAVLAAHFPQVFDSVADIYVFFLARGLEVLAPQRRLGMIVPNKWHRAAYGEKLRRALVEKAEPVTLIDFGHAPIFPDADTFPCILVVRNAQSAGDEEEVQVCSVPRELLPGLDLPRLVAQSSRPVRVSRLRPEGWDLEGSGVGELLEKIRRGGVPLREYIGGSPLYGIKTGLNEAFLIDQSTGDRLVAEDPKCEPIIKKFLRGRDIQRWHPQWGGQWMIVLKSSENHPWPWAIIPGKAESIFRKTYPSLHRHMKPHEQRLRTRQDKGRYWWELRSCDYYEALDSPKAIYQDIAFHSWFALDDVGIYSNNTCYFFPRPDPYLLAVLNSSVAWWYLSRSATHAKDEAFRLHGIFMELLPVAVPTEVKGAHVEAMTRQLVDLTCQRQHLNAAFSDWLRKLATTRATQKLETYWQLDPPALIAEVKRAGVRSLTPAAQKELLDEHARQAAELRPILAKIRQLEIDLQHLIFDLYGLTPGEVQLLRATAPPRDPLVLAEAMEGEAVEAKDEPRHIAANDLARPQGDRSGDSSLAEVVPDGGSAARSLPAHSPQAGSRFHGVRGRTGGSGNPGSPPEDPPRRRVESTRYIDTLAGPRSYADLAPDLGRAVEEVCARLAQTDPDSLLVTSDWICGLHRQAFGRFVDWAGRLRDRDVQIGDHLAPPYYQLPMLLHDYSADVEARLEAHRKPQPIERLADVRSCLSSYWPSAALVRPRYQRQAVVRHRALVYLCGLFSGLERRTSWGGRGNARAATRKDAATVAYPDSASAQTAEGPCEVSRATRCQKAHRGPRRQCGYGIARDTGVDSNRYQPRRRGVRRGLCAERL